MTPRDDDRAELLKNLAVSSNLFAPILGVVAIGLLACTIWAFELTGDQMENGLTLSRCAAIRNDNARLACFDKLAAPRPPVRGALAIFHNNLDERSQ